MKILALDSSGLVASVAIMEDDTGDIEEMEEIGYDDYFFGNGVCLIEWAELIQELLPEHIISVTIEKNPEKGFDYRKITIDGLEEERMR